MAQLFLFLNVKLQMIPILNFKTNSLVKNKERKKTLHTE